MGKIGGIKTPVCLSVELKTVCTKNWACAVGLTSHECKPPTRKCRCFIALLFMKISTTPYFKEIIVKWLLTLVLRNVSSAEAARLIGPIRLQCHKNVFSLFSIQGSKQSIHDTEVKGQYQLCLLELSSWFCLCFALWHWVSCLGPHTSCASALSRNYSSD